MLPVRDTIVPFQRLAISPARSKLTVQAPTGLPLVFVTTIAPPKPEPQFEVSLKEADPEGCGAGIGVGSGVGSGVGVTGVTPSKFAIRFAGATLIELIRAVKPKDAEPPGATAPL